MDSCKKDLILKEDTCRDSRIMCNDFWDYKDERDKVLKN
jgi:hypothetical protein